ncbi:MAG: hypothetical protein JWN14_2301 [Chthonomonadales bacterium]|nr:hypothetical protein [Chthonomonadales bacterium]
MNCHRAARLSSLGRDHRLSLQDRADLEDHLGLCPACRQREAGYDRLVNALSAQQAPEPTADLLEKALRQARATAPRENSTPGRTLLRVRITVVSVMLIVAVIALVGTRPPRALGQALLRKMEAAVGKATTMHVISWRYDMTEEEARNHTWHDGKTPTRGEEWVTHDAMSGGDALLGPYLWNATGYLHYDPTLRQVKYAIANREMNLKESIERSFNPVAAMKSAVPPGTYLTLHNFADTVWQGRKVHKMQIAAGPNKPRDGEEIPTQQEPGKTPSFGSMPRTRQTFWVDSETNLPVHSEQEKEIQGRWVVLLKCDYDYNRPTPTQLFDPKAVRKAAEAHAARKR